MEIINFFWPANATGMDIVLRVFAILVISKWIAKFIKKII
jgi:hypothetical protein